MRAGLPASAAAAQARMCSTSAGPHRERRHQQLAEGVRATEPGQVVEEVGQVGGDLLVAREEAEVLVEPRRDRVVVPGADVRVAPQPPSASRRTISVPLAWIFSVREAVDDVDAGRLERARPLDVAPLVEAGLQLDQADRLLALLGSLDQRRHVRRVVARAVDGRLDGNRLRVGRGGAHEPLEGARERVVRVMHEHRALAQLGEERLARRRTRSAPAPPAPTGPPSARAGRAPTSSSSSERSSRPGTR